MEPSGPLQAHVETVLPLLVARKLCAIDHILKIISGNITGCLFNHPQFVYLAVDIGVDFKEFCGREMRPSDM